MSFFTFLQVQGAECASLELVLHATSDWHTSPPLAHSAAVYIRGWGVGGIKCSLEGIDKYRHGGGNT